MSSALRYRVVKKIANGGMAEIFLARQLGAEAFEKPVVLKRILPAFVSDKRFVRMFLDEAHIASTLNHGNIVQILDLGKMDDQFFLVLEFVDGWSLEEVRMRAKKARMKLPLPLALYIVGAVCRALDYAHKRTREGRAMGIVHRDVSPQNVLLSREGEVKLADFGIAKASGRREESLTGVIKGKVAYMSPEQAHGAELDGRSDLFSIGTLLYLLTVGEKPFVGADDLAVLLDVRRARYAKPSTVSKTFNADVARLIGRALKVDRERRWQTGEQMGNRIDAILAKLGAQAGAGALKRWLRELGEKDGVRAPADADPAAPTRGTIELGSADVELEEVSPEPGSSATSRAPTLRRGSVRHAPHPAASRWLARTFRLVRQLVVGALVVLTLSGLVAYFAQPYLPAWILSPVEQWFERLPGRVRSRASYDEDPVHVATAPRARAVACEPDD